ncbi:MAG: hypothetical protein Q9214_002690, partial [Letrouitia sp. 1 TL-2023]
CWFNHKVLCCKSTTSDEAIGKCEWKGSAPICTIISGGHASCPANTAELTYSRSGAGGEAECSNGYKSLCCSQPPPYNNCNWQRHDNSWNFGLPLFCATRCPAGKTPIASDTEFCITGASLFCCDAPARSPDPAESTVHNYLQSFHDNPTCSGTRALSKRDAFIDSKDLDNDLIDSDANRTAIDAAFAILKQRQSTKLTNTQEIALMSALTTAFISLRSGAQTQLASSITQDFDQNIGPLLGLTSQSFTSVYDLFPAYDPRQVTEGILCQGQNAGRFLGDQQSVNTCACQLPSSIRPGANDPPPSSPHLSKRVIGWDWTSTPGSADGSIPPSSRLMIAGILNGQLQFMYTRLIRYNPENDGIIEMAWRIPPSQQYDIYRYVPEDQFFVIHAHVNHMVVTQEGGDRYVGVYQMNSFHGQNWDQDNNRVNGRPTNTNSGNNDNNNYQENLTQRTDVMACIDFPQRRFFYPGAPGSQPNDCDSIVGQLGVHLRIHGILDGSTLNRVGGNAIQPDEEGFIEDLGWEFLFRGESPSFDINNNPYQFPG